MTLIVAVANSDQVLIAADRLLTVDGRPFDDDVSKLMTVVCEDARLCIGYSGVAGWRLRRGHSGPSLRGGFRTVAWIAETLNSAAAADRMAEGVVSRFSEEASRSFGAPAIPPGLRGIAVVFAGYLYRDGMPHHFHRVVTNLHDDGLTIRDAFVEMVDPEPPPAYMAAVGVRAGLDEARRVRLAEAVSNRKPAHALRSLMVDLMQNAARSSESRGLIGSQISTHLIPADPRQQMLGSFHPDRVTREYPMSHHVDLRTERGIMLLDPRASGEVVSVPKARRHQPCPCGSGRKYGRCHGKHKWRVAYTVGNS